MHRFVHKGPHKQMAFAYLARPNNVWTLTELPVSVKYYFSKRPKVCNFAIAEFVVFSIKL